MNLSFERLLARFLRTRWLVRAPVWLYRCGFGWLFGSRMLLLRHRGRVSGESRYVVLEVVERADPATIIIVSGFGPNAQWYRNLRADPRCFVSTGRQRQVRARATFLPEAHALAVLERYARTHPQDWDLLRGAIERATGRRVQSLPMVRLDLLR